MQKKFSLKYAMSCLAILMACTMVSPTKAKEHYSVAYLTSPIVMLSRDEGNQEHALPLSTGEKVYILDTEGEFAYVCTTNGNYGYLEQDMLVSSKQLVFQQTFYRAYINTDQLPLYDGVDESAEMIRKFHKTDVVWVIGENQYRFWKVQDSEGNIGYVQANGFQKADQVQSLNDLRSVPILYLKKPEIKKEEQVVKQQKPVQPIAWNGQRLNKVVGTIQGPSGKETYYNLDMHHIVEIMRAMGNNDLYWIRDDGVKMLGDYVMVAAELHIRPRGSLVDTSLGKGIVVDTGEFCLSNPTQLDIAVAW